MPTTTVANIRDISLQNYKWARILVFKIPLKLQNFTVDVLIKCFKRKWIFEKKYHKNWIGKEEGGT